MTEPTTGDHVDVTTPDGDVWSGTVVDTYTDHITTDGADGTFAADVVAFERDDGHRMYVYDHADGTDLYTSRSASSSRSPAGTKAIVANDVTYATAADTAATGDFADPKAFDLTTIATGDTVAFTTPNGDVRTFDVVDVVVDPNGHGRVEVTFDDVRTRRARRLTSYGVGEAVSYADGDIAEPDHTSHSVTGIRVD